MAGRVKRIPGSETGRPPAFMDDKVRSRIISALATGNYASVSARYAGVSPASLQSWIAEGRDARAKADRGEDLSEREKVFLAFLGEVEDAEARAEVAVVSNLMRQTVQSPQAALGFLAVRFPDRWREKKAIEVSGPEGGPIRLSPVLAELPDEVLEDRIRALEAEIGTAKPKVLKGGKA